MIVKTGLLQAMQSILEKWVHRLEDRMEKSEGGEEPSRELLCHSGRPRMGAVSNLDQHTPQQNQRARGMRGGRGTELPSGEM